MKHFQYRDNLKFGGMIPVEIICNVYTVLVTDGNLYNY